MVITLIGMFVIRIGWIIVAMPIYNTIDIIYWSYPISWIFTWALTLVYYFKGKWRKRAMEGEIA